MFMRIQRQRNGPFAQMSHTRHVTRYKLHVTRHMSQLRVGYAVCNSCRSDATIKQRLHDGGAAAAAAAAAVAAAAAAATPPLVS